MVNNTKKCPYCGETIPANATTCPYCCEALPQAPVQNAGRPAGAPVMQCPYCHEQIPAGSKFCPVCGESLAASPAAPQPAPQPAYNQQPQAAYGAPSPQQPAYTAAQGADAAEDEENLPGFFEHYFYDTFIRHYSDFSGQLSRKQYWLGWVAYYLVALFVSMFVFAFVWNPEELMGAFVFLGLYFLAWAVPCIGAEIRRLHDIGKSGAWFFIRFVPFIGGIWALILDCTPGDTQCRRTRWNALDWLLIVLVTVAVISGCISLNTMLQLPVAG